MPQGAFFGPSLAQAVQNGTVPTAAIDLAVRRILTPMYAVGLFDRPARYLPVVNFIKMIFCILSGGNISTNVTSAHRKTLARRISAESHILLKNDGVLPLSLQVSNDLA